MVTDKLLVVVDMQNDFVTGSLGTKEAQAIVGKIKDYVEKFDGTVIFTQDTHDTDYLNTQEGKKLPVEHCIIGTDGWKVVPELDKLLTDDEASNFRIAFRKNTFGSEELANFVKSYKCKHIELVGVCTGICVIANAIAIKTVAPEAEITVHADMCACVTPESHARALESMRTLQIDIVGEK